MGGKRVLHGMDWPVCFRKCMQKAQNVQTTMEKQRTSFWRMHLSACASIWSCTEVGQSKSRKHAKRLFVLWLQISHERPHHIRMLAAARAAGQLLGQQALTSDVVPRHVQPAC